MLEQIVKKEYWISGCNCVYTWFVFGDTKGNRNFCIKSQMFWAIYLRSRDTFFTNIGEDAVKGVEGC